MRKMRPLAALLVTSSAHMPAPCGTTMSACRLPAPAALHTVRGPARAALCTASPVMTVCAAS
jgi:hypothetical protein